MNRYEYINQLRQELVKKEIEKPYLYTFEYEQKYLKLIQEGYSDDNIQRKIGYPKSVAEDIFTQLNVEKEDLKSNNESLDIAEESQENQKGFKNKVKKIIAPFINLIILILNIIRLVVIVLLAFYGVIGIILLVVSYVTLNILVPISFYINTLILYLLYLAFIHSFLIFIKSIKRGLKNTVATNKENTKIILVLVYMIIIAIIVFTFTIFYKDFVSNLIQTASDQLSTRIDDLKNLPIFDYFLK